MLKMFLSQILKNADPFYISFGDGDGGGSGGSGGGSGEDDDNTGEDDQDDDDKKDKGEKKKKGEDGSDEPKFTHTESDVNAAAANARKSADEKLLKKLGVENIDDAKKILKKHEDTEAANRTDLENAQKALEKLTDEKTEVDGTVKTLLSRVVSGAVKLEAGKTDYGIKPEVINDLWELIKNDEKIVEMLQIDETTFEVTGIDKAIKAAIKGREYMLVEEDNPKLRRGSPPKNTPRKPKPRDNSDEPVKKRTLTL